MKDKIKSIATIASAFGGALLIAHSSFANQGWYGGGSDGLGGYGGPEATPCAGDAVAFRIDCSGVSWLKYNYVAKNGFSGKYVFVPNGGEQDSGKTIGAECAKPGVGFYHLGVNVKATSDLTKGLIGEGAKVYPGVGNYVNTELGFYGIRETGTYAEDYTYRFDGINSWGHRLSFSINGTVTPSGGSYYDDKYMYPPEGQYYAHRLYYKGELVYKSADTSTYKSDIVKAYVAYLNTRYSNGKNASANETENCTYDGNKWSCSAMPRNIYAFCAYPIDSPTSLSPKAKITVDGNSKETSYNFSDTKTNDIAEDTTVHVVNKSQVSVRGDFSFKIGKTIKTQSFTPVLSINGTSISASALSFGGGQGEIQDGLNDNAKTKNVTLPANEVTRICVSATTKSSISQSNYNGADRTATACVNMKYEPITAEVDSHTEGKVEGRYLASGSTGFNSYKSDVDGDKTFSINVRSQPMKITWNNYLGYKNLSKTTTTVKSKYSINSEALDNKATIIAYPNGEKVATETIDTGVFPGETREEKRSIYHPSKVEASSGNAAAGAVKEHSSVTLKLYADDLRCGLDNDHMYDIGVDHPDDYFWLSMQRGDSNKVTVGSGMASQANMWFNPFDQMRVTQVACFGRQILVDSKDRPNKWTTNPWEINGATLENHVANTAFRLGGNGHDAIRSTGVFTNKSAANYVESHGGSSLWASEIGGTSSTPSARISKGYKLEATSETKQISNLGEDLQLTFYNPGESQSASINAKVPYNYYLDLSFSGSDGSTILDGVTSFKPKVTNEGRDNAQLCAGRESTCSAASIGTSTRTTHAATLIFSVDDSFTYEALKNSFDFAVDGNNTTERGILNSVKSRLGNAINVIDGSYFSYKDSGKKAISTNGYWKLNNPTTVDSRDYPVGTKICGVVAAYPADSHNTGDGRAIDDDAQIAAFNSYGGIFKTKFNISCRTVAKRQTMSVEGNGITALGLVKSSRVYYGTQNRIFGSWSEYQIIASGSDGKSASSGAVTAYGLDGTGGTTEAFATKAADTSSISGNGEYTLLFPQSLGNTKGDPYAPYEAKINWQYSENLISLIKNKYVSSNGSCVDITENRRALRCFTGDQSLGNSQVSIADMDTIVIYSSGKLTITENLSIPDTSRQLIIIAKSIEIANNVNEVNAWLIVDGGEFNTCAGHIIDQPNHPENPNSYGNMELLQECYNNLKINGPVILKTGKASGHNMIQLPRTFGGGSKPDGDSFVRAPETYVQRAEVFNYNPEIVEWAYNESRKEPQIVTTYTESLTPRL